MALLDVFKKRHPVAQNDDIGVYNVINEGLAQALGLGAGPKFVSETASALKVAAVYACVRLISGAIAQMPIRIYTDGPMGRKPSRKMTERLINKNPCPSHTGPMLAEWIVQRILLYGNAYVVIMRQGKEIAELLPFDGRQITIERKDGRLVYTLNAVNERGLPDYVRLDQDEVLHFVNGGELVNGQARSVIELGASRAVALEAAMEDYSERFFRQGALQQYAIIKQGNWNEEQRNNVRRSFMESYGQGVKGSFAPMVLDKTVDIRGLNINARDAQLLESRDFQIDDIARAFGVPSHLINREQKTTSFGSGVSEIGLSFTRYTLMPHIRRIEAEFDRKLFPFTSELVRFDTSALTRPTTRERYDSYRVALGGGGVPGFLTINEVRSLEDLTLLEGDEYDKAYAPSASSQQPPMMPPPQMVESETIEEDDEE